MKKTIEIIGIWIVIVIVSVFSVSFLPKEKGESYRSVELRLNTVEDGKSKRTDFLDADGNITTASDLGYATVLEQQIENGKIVTYYTHDGQPAFRYPGYSGRRYEYNDADYQITFLGINGEPVNLLLGYSKELHTFSDQEKIETICFYNTDGNQVYSLSDGYIKQNEYDVNGKIACTSYFDENREYMMTKRGYAKIRFSYYQSEGNENGKVEYELYYDQFGEPVSLSLGQFGVRKEYNDNGENIIITYIDSNGKPIVNRKGYSTIKTKYQGNGIIEQYYDQEGNPVSLSEGQYGILTNSDGTFFLDDKGKVRINIRNLLYNQTWIVIPAAFFLLFLAAVVDRNMNIGLSILYIGVIIYLTLLFRDSSTIRRQSIFGNFLFIFVDGEARLEIFRNILLFIPLGGLLYRIYPNKQMILVPIVLSVIIECIQYFMRIGYGGFEDILTNSFGGWVGFIGEKGLLEIIHTNYSKRKKQ